MKLPNSCLLFSTMILTSGAALAQAPSPAFPAKPIVWILPSLPGGSGDVYVRLYTQVITANTGWKFVMDYKPGAGAIIGTAYVAKAAPDGFTLLLAASTFTSTPLMQPDLPYDTVNSFAPISLLGNQTNALLVSAKFPAKNLKEYVAYAKANPGKLNFANNGVGGYAHLVSAALHHQMGITSTYINYKAGPQILAALMSGEADATITGIAGYMPQVKTGKLRLIGLAGIKRAPNLPDLPTLSEQGATGFDYAGWFGVLAPARTPVPIIRALNAEIVKATKDPELLEKLSPVTIVTSSTPEEFSELIVRQIARWQQLVKETNLRLTE